MRYQEVLIISKAESHISELLTSFFLVDMSRVQDDEVGDGTTSVTVLAAELLRVRISE